MAELIPADQVPGSFYMQGADDAFRLPRVVRYKSCMVTVTLESPDEQPDQCTWHNIKVGAGRVSSKCRSPGITDLTTGGFIVVGDRGAIMVSMEKYREDRLSLGYAATDLRFLRLRSRRQAYPGGRRNGGCDNTTNV